jgi:hypothetical protein
VQTGFGRLFVAKMLILSLSICGGGKCLDIIFELYEPISQLVYFGGIYDGDTLRVVRGSEELKTRF